MAQFYFSLWVISSDKWEVLAQSCWDVFRLSSWSSLSQARRSGCARSARLRVDHDACRLPRRVVGNLLQPRQPEIITALSSGDRPTAPRAERPAIDARVRLRTRRGRGQTTGRQALAHTITRVEIDRSYKTAPCRSSATINGVLRWSAQRVLRHRGQLVSVSSGKLKHFGHVARHNSPET